MTTESTTEEVMTQEEVIGTTSKLFGTQDTPEVKVAPEPVNAEPVVAETPATVIKDEAEYLSAEDFGNRLIKIKVDGVELEIPFKDAIRRIQTDKHLTEKGQRLAEERKNLELLKQSITHPIQAVNTEPESDDGIYQEYVKPHLSKYENEIQGLKSELKSMEAVMQPIKYQNNLRAVAEVLKEEGYDDFLDFVPKIESKIYSMPLDKQMEYDNPVAFIGVYKDIKIQELRSQASVKADNKQVDARPKPKITNIEGGSNAPSGADDFASQYQTAFKQAQATGDFTEVLRLKEAK